MKTKNRILENALHLFNDKGVKQVTLRKIAQSIGISQGNLNYHFKKKSEIVSCLYYQLVKEMDNEMMKITQEQPVFSFLYQRSLVSMQILYKYKFIAKDIFSVLASNTELRNHYLELQLMRKEQFLFLFQQMVNDGFMREEELKGEYNRLYERMNILGDSWINAADLYKLDNPLKISHYHALLFEVIYPYLTNKGKAQYRQLL